MMETSEIMQQALALKANQRFELMELLQQSLDKPDPEVERVWMEEANRRLLAYREGKLETISFEEVFKGL